MLKEVFFLNGDDVRGKKLLNEMLLAHKKYLPQFKYVINELEKIERAEYIK